MSSGGESGSERLAALRSETKDEITRLDSKMDGLSTKLDQILDLLSISRMKETELDVATQVPPIISNVSGNGAHEQQEVLHAESGVCKRVNFANSTPQELASDAQISKPYDPANSYETLIDPYPRTRKELTDYTIAATEQYEGDTYKNMGSAFIEDFIYWDESHFKLLPKPATIRLRDVLIDKGVGVRKEQRLPIYKALHQYVKSEVEAMEKGTAASAARKVGPNYWELPDPPGSKHVSPSSRPDYSKDFDGSAPSCGQSRHILSNRGRPSDIGKLFRKDLRYSGASREPIRRLWAAFMDSCELCSMDTTDTPSMMRLIQTSFVTGNAFRYFMDYVKPVAKSAEDAIDQMEAHFLSNRAKRVNDEIWNELSFKFVKKKREFDKLPSTNEECLNDLLSQIGDLADMRTSPGNDSVVTAKVIAAVRDIETFTIVCQNPPDGLQDLHAVLRSCALEHDREFIRNSSANAFQVNETKESSASMYVDRNVRFNHNEERKDRSIKGYGRPNTERRYKPRRFSNRETRLRVPPDVCIICHKKGCHSSKHRKRTKAFMQLAHSFASDGTDNDDKTSESESESESQDLDSDSYLAIANLAVTKRASASFGLAMLHPEYNVDAALIDTGSSILSTIGENLARAAQIASALPTSPNYNANPRTIGAVGSSVSTLGELKFAFNFGGRTYVLMLYIVPGNTPLLLSHKDLDSMGLNYQTLHKVVERLDDGYKEKVQMRNHLPFLVFSPTSYLTENQLRAIHRNLGHPSFDKQMKIIEQSNLDDLPDDTREKLEKIVKYCRTCQLSRAKPKRFLFSIRDDITGEFNHVIVIDVVKLSDGNVLHIMCKGTKYQSGTFLKDMTTKEIWAALQRSWINLYAGAPDIIEADAATNFTSDKFESLADEFGIAIKTVPTEAHDRIGAIERQHAALRAVYEKIKPDTPLMPKSERLAMAFRALNDAPDADTGITPTTLVFGVHPKLPGSRKRGTMAERAMIIREATKFASTQKARRLVRDAARRRQGPNSDEIAHVRQLAPGSNVLVHREKTGWQIYELVRVEGNDVLVRLPSGHISRFAIHNVHRYFENDAEDSCQDQRYTSVTPSYKPPWVAVAMHVRPEVKGKQVRFSAQIQNPDDPNFWNESRRQELQFLSELSVFEVVDVAESKGHRLYRSKFLDKIKANGDNHSRLCAAAWNDQEHGLFTAAPTIRRISLRLLFAICAAYGYELSSRDVVRAFLRSKTKLRRPIYMRAPKEMGLRKGQILKVLRPLYGMPESPIHWYKTYLDHHREELKMSQASLDPCLLYKHDASGNLAGVIGLQVDDTVFAGTKEFISEENVASLRFPNKGKETATEKELRFNGIDVSFTQGKLIARQNKYISKVERVKKNHLPTFEEFRSARAKYAYAAYSTMPDILIFVAQLSQVTQTVYDNNKKKYVKVLMSLEKALTGGPSLHGLRFVKLDMQRVEVFLCIDASFATNEDYSSQIGVLAMLREPDTGMCNVIHYTSHKTKRVCKSILAAELLAMTDGFDIGYAITYSVKQMTNRSHVDLTIATDSRSLFCLAITLGQTTERRLQIDLAAIREAYERRDIANLVWISGKSNPADDLTKCDKRNGILETILRTNKFQAEMESWVRRDSDEVRTSVLE